ncbi:MAG: GAF domain-containing protein [Pseudonocardiaceae bacterium]
MDGDRTADMRAAGGNPTQAHRLRLLMDAGLALSSELDVHALFERFTETACRLVDARYGALLIDDAGTLVKFVAHGIDPALAELIGNPPSRTGLHGYLLRDRQTLLIDDLTTDPRVQGFPPHHPVMRTFLGVPICYQGHVIGELLLTDKLTGPHFTTEDASITEVLASFAGIAYTNARILSAERQSVARAHILLELQRRPRLDEAVLWSMEWAREEERARLAREFHDGLGQMLTSIVLFAKDLEDAAEDELSTQVAKLRRLAEQTLRETRGFAQALRPFELDDLGLVPALQRLVDHSEQPSGPHIDFAVGAIRQPVAPEVETTVYRVVQEALTNAAKHAYAHSISVTLTIRGKRLITVVEDDGRGFDAQSALRTCSTSRGLGLVDMAERARYVGGQLSVESHPGAGTMVRLVLPVRPRKRVWRRAGQVPDVLLPQVTAPWNRRG